MSQAIERVGRVNSYASARLTRHPGATLTSEAITLDYQRWCASHGYVPFRDGVFREALARLAPHLGLRREANDADTLYRDVAFVSPP